MAALPRPTPGVLSASGSGTHPVARPRREPVLVLEPDAHTRALVASTLEEFHVHESESLSAAGAMVSELRPHAIVCSMTFDPVELLCFVRYLRGTFGRTIGLVMLTSRGDAMQAIRAVQLGARASVEVPIDPARLRLAMAKITALFGGAGERSGAA